MKKLNIIFSVLCLCFFAINSNAQIKTPAASPSASITQTVGLVDVTIDYSRPGVKGRSIFAPDGLVAFDQIWRTGANSATKLTVSGDIMIGGEKLEKGSYAILSKPSSAAWEFYFYPYESSRWSTYSEKTPVATVKTKAYKTNSKVESMIFTFTDLKDDGATLNLSWENASVNLDVTVETDKAVMSNIDKVLSGPSKGDFYNAANYYFSSGKDLNKAYEFIQKATAGDDKKFWQVRKQSQIEAALGKYKAAIKTAKTSMELSEKAGNMEYVKFNKQAIAKWTEMK